MSKRKTERNKEIYKLYTHPKKGMSTYALARQYLISPPRILKIIKAEEIRIKEHKSYSNNKKTQEVVNS